MNKKTAPTILLSLGLLALPGLFALEKTETKLWNSRLYLPALRTEPNLHTPHHSTGTYLPATISDDRTLTPADNPVILTTPTTVSANTVLTVNPGTRLYALEHANLTVAGTLHLQGTTDRPITFASNESHPANRSWGGLTITSTGTITGQHTTITHAHPGISCLLQASANLASIEIMNTNTALYTASRDCRLTASRLQARQTGIISTLQDPPITQTTIQSPQKVKLVTPTSYKPIRQLAD